MESMYFNYNIQKRRSFYLNRLWVLCLISSVVAIGFIGCGEANTNRVILHRVEQEPDCKVIFDSFANVGYGKLKSLPGLLTTRDAIETTLKTWFSDFQSGQTVVDGSIEDLENFLTRLPGSDDCDISIVFLGSIQSPKADWKFTNGEFRNFHELLDKIKIKPNPNRIIIFDTCHAETICDTPRRNNFLGRVTLLASGRDEKAYQFSPSALNPIDIRSHYQWAWQWGQRYLPRGWDKHISFLGLVWLETAGQRQIVPCDIMQWKKFFDDCSNNAQIIENTIGRRCGSTIMICPETSDE